MGSLKRELKFNEDMQVSVPGQLSLEGRDIGHRDIYKEESPGEDPARRGCHKPRRPISGEFDPVTTSILGIYNLNGR